MSSKLSFIVDQYALKSELAEKFNTRMSTKSILNKAGKTADVKTKQFVTLT